MPSYFALAKANPALFGRRFVYWGFTLSSKVIVTVICQALMTKGLINVFPDMGTKLYRVVPGLGFFEYYTALHKISLASVASMLPVILSWIAYSLVMTMYLRPQVFNSYFSRWGDTLVSVKRTVTVMSVILIVGDAALFAAAFMMSGWGPSRFPAAAILATLVYQTVIAFCTFCSMYLSDQILALKEKNISTPKEEGEVT